MRPLICEIRPEDARAFLEVHHAAVRGHASKDYSSEVIEAWAPMPITAQQVEGVRSNPDGEYRLGAEIGGRLVGIGVVQKNELVLAMLRRRRAGGVSDRHYFGKLSGPRVNKARPI